MLHFGPIMYNKTNEFTTDKNRTTQGYLGSMVEICENALDQCSWIWQRSLNLQIIVVIDSSKVNALSASVALI